MDKVIDKMEEVKSVDLLRKLIIEKDKANLRRNGGIVLQGDQLILSYPSHYNYEPYTKENFKEDADECIGALELIEVSDDYPEDYLKVNNIVSNPSLIVFDSKSNTPGCISSEGIAFDTYEECVEFISKTNYVLKFIKKEEHIDCVDPNTFEFTITPSRYEYCQTRHAMVPQFTGVSDKKVVRYIVVYYKINNHIVFKITDKLLGWKLPIPRKVINWAYRKCFTIK